MWNSDLRLAIATINYRTADLTIECIESVLADQANLPEFHLYVIDNASNDGSVDTLRECINRRNWQEQVSLIESDKNGGFAYGNNLIINRLISGDIKADYLWCLNPDTRVKPGAARALIEFLQENPTAMIAGSSITTGNDKPATAAYRFHTPTSELLYAMRLGLLDRLFRNRVVALPPTTGQQAVDWVCGASFLVNCRYLSEIGGMDERYFLYYEEVDWFMHIKRQGHEVWHVPSSKIYHIHGASTGMSELRDRDQRLPQYWFDSRHRYFVKNFGRWGAIKADLFALGGFVLWRARRLLQRKTDRDPPHYLSDLWRNSVFVRGFSIDPAKTGS